MTHDRITIHDVARTVGVSPATVSRALARPHMVATETAARVRQAADTLGYLPSPQARWMSTGCANAVTLVLPDITNPFFFDLIRGAQHEAARCGYSQVLADCEESPEQERAYLLVAREVSDGALLAAPRLPDVVLREMARSFPLVVVNRRVRGIASVVVDTLPALQEAVAHLARLGHRRILYLGGPRTAWMDARRWNAIRSAADRHQIHCRRLSSHAPTMEAGRQLSGKITAGAATAVITFNDLQALGLMSGLRQLGVGVPEQLSIVGCDDIFGADLTSPGLTTVSVSAELVGKLGVRALLDRVGATAGGSRLDQLLVARLTTRGSTGPAPATRSIG